MQLHITPPQPPLTISSYTTPPKITLSTKRKKNTSQKKTPQHSKRPKTPNNNLIPHYPKSSPTPLLLTQPPSTLTRQQALDQIIHSLQSYVSRRIPLDDPSIFSSILESCYQMRAPVKYITLIHSLIPPYLLHSNPGLSCKLVRLYSANGLIEEAHQLFDLMPHRNKTSAFPWNSLIAGYVELGLYEDAMAMYYQMEEDGVEPDCFTFPRVLKACAGVGSVQHGEAVHRHVVRSGFGTDAYVLNALVDMYAKCGDILKARRIFDRISDRDAVSWNSMLVGYIRHGLLVEAFCTCRGMLKDGIQPDSITISSMLAKSSMIDKVGLEIHGWVLRRGLEGNLSIANSLIGMYSVRDQLNPAWRIFESIRHKDLVSWNAIIYAHCRDHRVVSLFRQMEECGPPPDRVTLVSLLSACANLGMVEEGRRLFYEMEKKYGIKRRKEHYGCMVNMLGRAGLVDEAYDIVSKEMPFDGGPTVWGALLYACSVHGYVDIGEVAAEKLFELEPDNEHNFELMMKIYKNAGKLQGVEKVKELLRERGLGSYSC